MKQQHCGKIMAETWCCLPSHCWWWATSLPELYTPHSSSLAFPGDMRKTPMSSSHSGLQTKQGCGSSTSRSSLFPLQRTWRASQWEARTHHALTCWWRLCCSWTPESPGSHSHQYCLLLASGKSVEKRQEGDVRLVSGSCGRGDDDGAEIATEKV